MLQCIMHGEKQRQGGGVPACKDEEELLGRGVRVWRRFVSGLEDLHSKCEGHLPGCMQA